MIWGSGCVSSRSFPNVFKCFQKRKSSQHRQLFSSKEFDAWIVQSFLLTILFVFSFFSAPVQFRIASSLSDLQTTSKEPAFQLSACLSRRVKKKMQTKKPKKANIHRVNFLQQMKRVFFEGWHSAVDIALSHWTSIRPVRELFDMLDYDGGGTIGFSAGETRKVLGGSRAIDFFDCSQFFWFSCCLLIWL